MKSTFKIMTRKALILTGYQCNNNCRFCSTGSKNRLINRTFQDIIIQLKKERRNGAEAVEFTGGEPSIRPDIIKIVRQAKKIGYQKISLESNGRMFSQKSFTEEIILNGLTKISFSIHGSNAKTHDCLTRSPGSFKQVKGALKLFKNYKNLELIINFVIVKKNYKQMNEFMQLIKRMAVKVDNICFSFVNPTGNALKNYQKIVPQIFQVSPYINKVVQKFPDFSIKISNIPPCYLKDYDNLNFSLKKKKNVFKNYMDEEEETLFKAIKQSKIKPRTCIKCQLRHKCEGVWKNYIKIYGDSEFKPISK